MFIDGKAWGTDIWVSSKKFKKDIENLSESESSKIYSLRPVSYNWKDSERGTGRNIGLIAEEVNEHFPEMVMRDKGNEIFSVDYKLLISPMLVEMKKHKEQITSQQDNIAELNEKIRLLEEKINNL